MPNIELADVVDASTIELSGSTLRVKDAGITPAKIGFTGAMVKKSVDQTGADFTAATAIAWDSEVYDVSAWHDNAVNNTRLTVPSGVTYVVVSCNMTFANVAANQWMQLAIRKNGSSTFDGAAAQHTYNDASTVPKLSVTTGPIAVVATDYFEAVLDVESDTSIDITAARSNFSIYAVG